MKKLLSALAVCAFVLGTAVVSYAAGEQVIKGEVVSIDSAGKTIVINTEQGQKTVVFGETTKGLEGVKPGAQVEMTCIDVDGKACAKNIEVISVSEASKPTRTFEGEVVSIDPGGKTVVIKNPKGEEMTIKITTPYAEEMKVNPMTKTVEGMVACEPLPVTQIAPGSHVLVDCFDSGGTFCATRISVISPEKAGMAVTGEEVAGEVVSIDPAGKSVVIKTATGEKTLYYQKSSAGVPMSGMEVGKQIKAYCLDVEGKSCIRNIEVTK